MSLHGIFCVNPWGHAWQHHAKHDFSQAYRHTSFVIHILIFPSWASHDEVEVGVMGSVIWSRASLIAIDTPIFANPTHALTTVWVRTDNEVSCFAWCSHDKVLASLAS